MMDDPGGAPIRSLFPLAVWSSLLASVCPTSARTPRPPIRFGHIDQRKLRRRVGPTQVAPSSFVTSVEVTEARSARSDLGAVDEHIGSATLILCSGWAGPRRLSGSSRFILRCRRKLIPEHIAD